MKCPDCGHKKTKVIDTRKLSETVVRIRKCAKCKHLWETEEKICGFIYEGNVKNGEIR
jgi:transcriptional regulator NrdR family protein